ncbi:MAG: serine hydrolase domain-containing protein [Bacteroidota bacterium]|jgi:D-alanyl-D-alanine carboxypeptidase
MKKYILYFALAVLAFSYSSCEKEIGHSSDCASTNTLNHPRSAEYQAILDQYTKNSLPGISALIRDKYGVWTGASGFSDISQEIPMRSCTVSKAASITKSFIGALTLKLAEEGKLNLDDPLSKWIDVKYLDPVKNARESTLRMCLNHTTGISDVISDNGFYLALLNNPDKKWKPEELLEFVYGDEPEYAPGTDASYSNTNFIYLAMAVETATGKDQGVVLREKILGPLGLNDTWYYWHDNLPPNTAQGYYDLHNNGTILNVTNYNTGSGNGYGGLYSTVFDLQTFIEALVREKRVLSQEYLDQMLTFTDSVETYSRANGLGIFRDFLERAPDEYAYGHRGRDLGYTADMYWFPEKDITMVYLVNYGTDAESGLKKQFRAFRNTMVDALMRE